MQEALVSPANANRLRSAFELKPYAFGDQRLSSSPRYLPSGDDGLYRCSSPFSPSLGFSSPSPLATSVSLSPSSSGSLVDDSDYDSAAAADATGHRLQLARLALQYQEVADRYEMCLSHLAEAVDEAAVLRRENTDLRVASSDLARRVALLGGKRPPPSSSPTRYAVSASASTRPLSSARPEARRAARASPSVRMTTSR
ncbi:hypothetical protein ZWY2020_003967 [Hordeum vulgare]|nr:hypothetical protein ZWY2020_003967 [Hordeum vulgare]